MLSRFDLCFIIEDKPSDEIDKNVGLSVLRNHLHDRDPVTEQSDQIDYSYGGGMICNKPAFGTCPTARIEHASRTVQRIKANTTGRAPIPTSVMKDYIAYARQYCHPKLKRKAAQKLSKFWIGMKHDQHCSIPVSTRQLESMVRLCQARAKCCLRNEVTEEDADDVIELVGLSIFATLMDEDGNLEVSRGSAAGFSKNKQKKALGNSLRAYMKANNYDTFTMKMAFEQGMIIGLEKRDVRCIIDELREAGEVLKERYQDVDLRDVYKFI